MTVAFRTRAVAARGEAEVAHRVRVVRPPAWFALALALLGLAGLLAWMLLGRVAITTRGVGVITNPPANAAVVVPVEGVLRQAPTQAGETATAGETLAVIATGTGEVVEVASPVDGTVVGLGPGPGAAVHPGETLVMVAPTAATQIGYIYVPSSANDQVRPEMQVFLSPASTNSTADGVLLGTVSAVSPLPVSEARVRYITGNEELTASALSSGPVDEVQVALVPAPTPSGWQWTRPQGPGGPIVSGTPTDGVIIIEMVRPYAAFTGRT